MKNCPQCGQPRVAETYKCPACEVFYSQLDELLYEEQQRLEARTFKAHLRRIWAAEDKQQALADALHTGWRETPWQTQVTLVTVFAFIFVLVFGVLTL